MHSVLKMIISSRRLQPLHYDIFGCIILCCGECPVLHSVHSSFPGLYLLYIGRTLSSSPTSIVKSQNCQMSLGDKMVPGENYSLWMHCLSFSEEAHPKGPRALVWGLWWLDPWTLPFFILVVWRMSSSFFFSLYLRSLGNNLKIYPIVMYKICMILFWL